MEFQFDGAPLLILRKNNLTVRVIEKSEGFPPGKRSDPLGDQLSWEQLLLHACRGKARIWMITRDSDYCLKSCGKLFLNPFLSQEIKRAALGVEILCFENMKDGLKDFVQQTGITAKMPTPKDSEEIKEELDSVYEIREPYLSAIAGFTSRLAFSCG